MVSPGLDTSMQKAHPSASKTCGGVYHSSDFPTHCSCRAIFILAARVIESLRSLGFCPRLLLPFLGHDLDALWLFDALLAKLFYPAIMPYHFLGRGLILWLRNIEQRSFSVICLAAILARPVRIVEVALRQLRSFLNGKPLKLPDTVLTLWHIWIIGAGAGIVGPYKLIVEIVNLWLVKCV